MVDQNQLEHLDKGLQTAVIDRGLSQLQQVQGLHFFVGSLGLLHKAGHLCTEKFVTTTL